MLPHTDGNLAQHSVQTIVLITAEDADVQHLWSTVAMDTSDDKELLVEMTGKWVNMRGHSIRSKMLDDYKKLKREEWENSIEERTKMCHHQYHWRQLILIYPHNHNTST